jgi:thiosulfate/3-mercaptopyruvate sulfurtransferase
MSRSVRSLVALTLWLTGAAPSAQVANRSSRDALVVDAAWLGAHLNDANLVILQVGRKATYDAGHVPGARFVDFDNDGISVGHSASAPLALEMPAAPALHDQLAALGIGDASRVVVVASDGSWSLSTRVVVTLDYAGLANVVWLDGGLKTWTDAGRPISKDTPAVKIGALSPLTLRPVVVDADFVRTHGRTPGFAIVDARTRTYYDGIPLTARAGAPQPKLGHIPGALSAPFDAFLEGAGTGMGSGMMLGSAAQIEAVFAAAGVKPGDTIIGYCHIGMQATAMLFAARTLGHDVLLYDGSFQDWQKRDLPVENPSQKDR